MRNATSVLDVFGLVSVVLFFCLAGRSRAMFRKSAIVLCLISGLVSVAFAAELPRYEVGDVICFDRKWSNPLHEMWSHKNVGFCWYVESSDLYRDAVGSGSIFGELPEELLPALAKHQQKLVVLDEDGLHSNFTIADAERISAEAGGGIDGVRSIPGFDTFHQRRLRDRINYYLGRNVQFRSGFPTLGWLQGKIAANRGSAVAISEAQYLIGLRKAMWNPKAVPSSSPGLSAVMNNLYGGLITSVGSSLIAECLMAKNPYGINPMNRFRPSFRDDCFVERCIEEALGKDTGKMGVDLGPLNLVLDFNNPVQWDVLDWRPFTDENEVTGLTEFQGIFLNGGVVSNDHPLSINSELLFDHLSYANRPVGAMPYVLAVCDDNGDGSFDYERYWVVARGVRHWIPNEDIFYSWGFSFTNAIRLDCKTLNSFPQGRDVYYSTGLALFFDDSTYRLALSDSQTASQDSAGGSPEPVAPVPPPIIDPNTPTGPVTVTGKVRPLLYGIPTNGFALGESYELTLIIENSTNIPVWNFYGQFFPANRNALIVSQAEFSYAGTVYPGQTVLVGEFKLQIAEAESKHTFAIGGQVNYNSNGSQTEDCSAKFEVLSRDTAAASSVSQAAVSETQVQAASLPPESNFTTAGLISYWPTDNNANDVLENNPGQLLNGTTFALGKVGQAFSFDGNDDRVELTAGNNFYSGSEPRTIMAWIYPKSYAYYQMIFSSGQALPDKGFSLGFSARTDKLMVGKYGKNAPNATIGVPLNEWSLVAVTYGQGLLTYYVNGQPAGSYVFTGVDTGAGYARIGRSIPGWDDTDGLYTFDGLIDEMAVFNIALTPAEILKYYQEPIGAATNAPVQAAVNESALATQTVMAPPAPNYDTNGDGVFNIEDLIGFNHYFFWNGPKPLRLDRADFDGNGVIDIQDLVIQLQALFNVGVAQSTTGQSLPRLLQAFNLPAFPSPQDETKIVAVIKGECSDATLEIYRNGRLIHSAPAPNLQAGQEYTYVYSLDHLSAGEVFDGEVKLTGGTAAGRKYSNQGLFFEVTN